MSSAARSCLRPRLFDRYNIVSPGDVREAARKLDHLLKDLERETGIEPATSSLGNLNSD